MQFSFRRDTAWPVTTTSGLATRSESVSSSSSVLTGVVEEVVAEVVLCIVVDVLCCVFVTDVIVAAGRVGSVTLLVLVVVVAIVGYDNCLGGLSANWKGSLVDCGALIVSFPPAVTTA